MTFITITLKRLSVTLQNYSTQILTVLFIILQYQICMIILKDIYIHSIRLAILKTIFIIYHSPTKKNPGSYERRK